MLSEALGYFHFPTTLGERGIEVDRSWQAAYFSVALEECSKNPFLRPDERMKSSVLIG